MSVNQVNTLSYVTLIGWYSEVFSNGLGTLKSLQATEKSTLIQQSSFVNPALCHFL